MKKFLISTVLCLTAFFASANNYRGDGDHYKYEEKKTVEKTFDVKADPILEMNGKYSDFIITTWDQQQIDFKVTIVLNSDNSDKLKAKFNSIDIKFDKEGNKVEAETVFGDYPYKSFNGSITIKYYVKVPDDVFMELATKYGDITVETVNKRFEVDIKYGDLTADKLLADSHIDIKYGNFDINEAKDVYLELDYGDGKINKCEYLDSELKYSEIKISEMNDGILENKYSDVRIEKANKVQFRSTQYSEVRVKEVVESLSARLQYSDLKIKVTTDKPNIDIDGQYSDMIIYLNESASFNYSLSSSYCDIRFKGFFDANSISGSGHYGDGERGRLNITTRYGDVEILKNK